MALDRQFSVGDEDPASAGVRRSGRQGTGKRACGDPERWVAIWPPVPGEMTEVLDHAFIHKSLKGPDGPGPGTASDGLPQG